MRSDDNDIPIKCFSSELYIDDNLVKIRKST